MNNKCISILAPLGLTTILLVAATSCKADDALFSDGPFSIESDATPISGIKYQLALDVLSVTVSSTKKEMVTLSADLSDLEREVVYDVSVTPTLVTIGDPLETYVLDLNYGAFRDDTLTVSIAESGLLSSINQTSSGRVGSFISSLGKVVATVAGVLGAGDLALSAVPAPAQCIASSSLPAEIRDRYFEQKSDGRYHLVVSALKGTRVQRAYISRRSHINPGINESEGCTEWQNVETAAFHLRQNRSEISALQNRLLGASEAEAPRITTQLVHARDVEKQQESVLARTTNVFNAGVAALERYLSLGDNASPAVQETYWVQPDLLSKRDDIYDKTRTQITSELAGSPIAREIFEKFGIVLTIDIIGEFGRSPLSNLPNCSIYEEGQLKEDRKKLRACNQLVEEREEERDARACPINGRNVSGYIFYRAARPAVIEAFSVDKANGAKPVSKAKLFSHVITSGDASCLRFDASSLANRTFSVTFDARGRPTTLGRTGTSTAAALAEGLANAATTTRDTYAESLKKALDIRNTSRELAIADLKDETADLKAQTEALNADIALQNATATQEQTLHLATLQAEIKLLEAQLKRDQTEFNLEIDPEVREAKAELEALKRQLQIDIESSTHDSQLAAAIRQRQLTQLRAETDTQILQATAGLETTIAELNKQLSELRLQLQILQAQEALKNPQSD